MALEQQHFDVATGNIFDKIKRGAQANLLVRITYTDKDGSQTIRSVEPYEFKAGKLYAHCRVKDGIRAFDLTRISHAEVTTDSFAPRFEIKFG